MWSKTYDNKAAFDADKGVQGASLEETQQITVARNAAAFLFQSGAIGTDDAQVILSGHANPDHKPATLPAEENIHAGDQVVGAPDECINVTVRYTPRAV